MKKVCFITTVSMTLKAFVVDTALEMRRRHPDWDITFVCDMDEDFARSLPADIHYHPISMKRGVSLAGLRSLWQMMQFFKNEQFDLIQYATPNAALYASIAGKLVRAPMRLYCQWGIRYVGFSGKTRWLFRVLEKITCACSTHIHAVSLLNREFAITEGLYPATKAVVVGNGGTIGVDLTRYELSQKDAWREEVRKKHALGDSVVFGFVGRLSRDKGMVELLTAMRELSRTRDVKLVCVGESEFEESLAPELVAWARESGHMVFAGQQSPNEVCRYYAAMDVYVHPTYREGFGMVLQEAGAMACPVITTRVPGASEVLQEEISCLLCEPRNADSLYDAMKTLCEDRERCRTMGNAARVYVEQRYERGLMLDNQMKRYEELLGEEVLVCN